MRMPRIKFEADKFGKEDQMLIRKAIRGIWTVAWNDERTREQLSKVDEIFVQNTKRTDKGSSATFEPRLSTSKTLVMRMNRRDELDIGKGEYLTLPVHEIMHSYMFVSYRTNQIELEELVVDLATSEAMRKVTRCWNKEKKKKKRKL